MAERIWHEPEKKRAGGRADPAFVFRPPQRPSPDARDGGLKLGFAAGGFAAGLAAVVVNGGDGILEEFGDARAVSDAEADEGEDSELGVEVLAGLECDAVFLVEQAVEFLDEVGEKAEEGAVELAVELASFGFDELVGADGSAQLVGVSVGGELHEAAAVVVEFVDVDGAAVDVSRDVFLFDGVGLSEGVVGGL